jgi:dCTP deaminase
MIVNGKTLLLRDYEPIKDMLDHKVRGGVTSHGLSEAGYDVRVKQDLVFTMAGVEVDGIWTPGTFTLASTIEEFNMPRNLCAVVHDKSSWARRGVSVFNTVIEPGWKGFLTLELVYHGRDRLHIPAGSGIAQLLFHSTLNFAQYDGKYQNQPDHPVAAIDG